MAHPLVARANLHPEEPVLHLVSKILCPLHQVPEVVPASKTRLMRTRLIWCPLISLHHRQIGQFPLVGDVDTDHVSTLCWSVGLIYRCIGRLLGWTTIITLDGRIC